MEEYPIGTRTLLRISLATGWGVHEMYQLWLVKRLVIFADKWAGRVSTRPK